MNQWHASKNLQDQVSDHCDRMSYTVFTDEAMSYWVINWSTEIIELDNELLVLKMEQIDWLNYIGKMGILLQHLRIANQVYLILLVSPRLLYSINGFIRTQKWWWGKRTKLPQANHILNNQGFKHRHHKQLFHNQVQQKVWPPSQYSLPFLPAVYHLFHHSIYSA